MKLRIAPLLLCGLCLASIGPQPAHAGVPSADSTKSVMIPPSSPQDDWYLKAAIYLWATAVDGDTGFNGITFPADMKFKDLLEDLDFAYQGYFEVGRGRWSLGVDAIYAKLSDDQTFASGAVIGSASSETEQALITARVQYRLIEEERCTVDVFAGIRWNYFSLDLDLEANLGLGGLHSHRSEDWVDPIIGFGSDVDITDKWFLHLMGDIGGFGAASDLTWQALAGFGYRFNPRTSGFVGYRALGVDYDRDDFLMDTITHGPMLGLIVTF